MLQIQARLSTVDGKGVGPWRNYYKAEDMQEAVWRVGDLVPKCLVRIKEGKDVVCGPCRAEEIHPRCPECRLPMSLYVKSYKVRGNWECANIHCTHRGEVKA